MKKHFIIFFLFASLIIYGLSLSSDVVLAVEPLLTDSIIKDAECSSDDCTLNTFIALGVRLSNIILGLVGALTLAMFIYGGVTLLISGGSAEKISKGKEIILGSVIGLLIVFGSYTIIKFVVEDVLEANQRFSGAPPADVVKEKENTTIGDECRKIPYGQCISSNQAICVDTWGQAGQIVGQKDCGAGQVCCDLQNPPSVTCVGSGHDCQQAACNPALYEPTPLVGFPCSLPGFVCCKRISNQES